MNKVAAAPPQDPDPAMEKNRDDFNAADKQNSASGPAPEAGSGIPAAPATRPREIGGPKGPEPTRYGDWENKGRCSDF